MLSLKTLFVGMALTLAALSTFAESASAPATPLIDQRQENQDKRIEKGEASGQLTKHEARRLKHEQGAIDKAKSRAKADGVVSKHERRHVHRMQGRASKDIAHQKHDAQTADQP